MIDIRKKLATVLLKKAGEEIGESSTLRYRYKQFRISLLVAITIVAMLPATAISILGYFQYMVLLEKQELQHLHWHLDDSTAKVKNLIDKTLLESGKLPDTTTLKQFIPTINRRTDTFLIDKKNILLSPSQSFGSQGDSFPLTITDQEQSVFMEKKGWGMGSTFYAVAPLANSSWFLVLVKDGPLDKEEWFKFQLTLLATFLTCLGIGLFIIFQLVSILTGRIRESDSKRMALLSEAEHSNKLASIGRLAAGIAHEINNPLAVIDQKAGLIEDFLDFSEDFPHKDKMDLSIIGIHDGVQRCKVITHRLLSFARKMDTRVEPIDLNEVLLEVMGFLEKEALHHQIRIAMHLDDDLPKVESDQGQLQQIFLNIINNGIDAVGLDGMISLESRQIDKEHIQVTVSDSGPGIEPAVLKHIFDPFFTTKETGKGTGLGLSITYGLVKRLGGDIQVESELGVGTSFNVILPLHHKAVTGEIDA